ncbi:MULTISPECIES: DUF3772 domain-containing protein [unclassified Beijerinckia]|uniref:DUF3772 domain-containing protein n=1 Tax=unclassified Beijerinckia TaxID=2638183 RepID=UPI00089BE675|nr:MULTISPECIES: DUF3772 domain-containing protein [unclassified Beijerinckia]MDH7798205.1 potassium efflux system protein [Beijerinckia sp. GAS462]SED12779.1 Small-conductance mechanosensitive channel [Beijerinckia sp. 28-YEA-48]
MLNRLRPLIVAVCLFITAGVLVGSALAQTTAATVGAKIDAARASLSQVEKSLANQDLSDAALLGLRNDLDPVTQSIQDALSELTPRLDEIKTRLDQLGPKPAAGATPEAQGVTTERDDQQKRFNDIDAQVKRGRLLLVQTEQVGNSIVNRRRATFRQALFQLSSSILNPRLWISAVSELPRDAQAARFVIGEWLDNAAAQLRGSNGWIMAGLVAAIALGYAIAKMLANRILSRTPTIQEPSRLAKALAAIWVAVVTAVVPIVATILLIEVARAFNIVTPRTEPVAQVIFEAVRRIAITAGIVRGLLAPSNSDWRLLDLTDETVERLARLAIAVAVIVSGLKVIEAFNDLVAANVRVSVLLRAVVAVIVGVLMVRALYGVAPPPDPADDCFGPPIVPTRDWYAIWRTCAWAVIAIILGASLIGYIALATFFVDQLIWVTFVGAAAYLLYIVAEDGLASAFQPQAAVGRAIMNSIGLKGDGLLQLSVVLRGLASVILWVVVALLILAPWGIESDDMLGSVRAAFFGFQVGDLTISLATVFSALLLFIVGFLITRAVQNWLEGSLLPHTHLDLGLRASIRTSVGYVGMLLSLGVALAHVGIGLDKLAIVAGALSIGIGFGLQSIVNNFVSGLILLWERAVRVGDWIVVGDEQGYVRRINVRSTEIETFDRATMIVPNSNMVSGVVKNWVRSDRVGRIKIPVVVTMAADPDHVREVLLGCVKGQEMVLATPQPSVVFASMENVLRFELVCFVSDVEKSAKVRSDLNFKILRCLRDAKIEMNAPAPAPIVVKVSN